MAGAASVEAPAAASKVRRLISMVLSPSGSAQRRRSPHGPEPEGAERDGDQGKEGGGGADGVDLGRQLAVELGHHRQRQGGVGAGGEHAAGVFVIAEREAE